MTKKFKLGIDVLSESSDLKRKLHNHNCGFLGNAASISSKRKHSLDVLMEFKNTKISCAFGPQHGIRGEKQDNMMESDDFVDPVYGIPVFSLYGKTRRPTKSMMDSFDLLLVDLQDVGCRVYTFITTLFYMLEACHQNAKTVWMLDRPNPVGRSMDGTILKESWTSFVGHAQIPMCYGFTIGELAQWYVRKNNLNLSFQVIKMREYDPLHAPEYGWPYNHLCWVNPSPNASSWNMTRCYPGTVLVEGTTLSEGRGTTKPLEIIGAPDININKILNNMQKISCSWMQGCWIRPCYFEPTFHKHKGKLCNGFQIQVDPACYDPVKFKPYRLMALFLKSLRQIYPDYDLWNRQPYEYEIDRLAIDVINGGPLLRQWVDDPKAQIGDLEIVLQQDEISWKNEQKLSLIY